MDLEELKVLLSRMLCQKDPGSNVSGQHSERSRLRRTDIKGKPVAGILWKFTLNQEEERMQ